MKRPAVAALLLAAVGVGTLACLDSSEPFLRATFGFTFENELDWEPDGTDLDDPPVAWSIERSNELAEESTWSARLTLNNLNDAGKIWIERPFVLPLGETWDVQLGFDFASADFGDVNTWTIIAGAGSSNPETAADLTFQESTANGSASDVGHVWQHKDYLLTATTGNDGVVWVALGVWGTSEFARTYFIDNVELTFTAR